MKKEHVYELTIAILTILPFAYLASVWSTLPEQVATHFNFNGDPDRYSSKTTLITILSAVCLLTWVLLKILPAIDPRNKLKENPSIVLSIRLMIAAFTSAIGVVVVMSAQDSGKSIGSILPLLMGGLFAGAGNYLINIKPNYFIGIRTPWTLESESVWRRTHRIGGKMMFWGGVAIVLTALLLPIKVVMVAMIALPIVTALIPVGLSYVYFREEQAGNSAS